MLPFDTLFACSDRALLLGSLYPPMPELMPLSLPSTNRYICANPQTAPGGSGLTDLTDPALRLFDVITASRSQCSAFLFFSQKTAFGNFFFTRGME